MDGNRRFADRLRASSTAVGHNKGFLKLMEALEWCLEMGIECVSVYAFSIDNFKRSPEEVATLMSLAETKLLELAQEEGLMKEYGIQVRVIGDLQLLPPAVQNAAAKVMEATKASSRAILNICMAYTSSQELAQAVKVLQQEGSLAVGQQEFERHLYTKGCPPVDLLVRTSGEERLSDFLLWQSSTALLHFTPVLWPDFSFLDLLRAVISFQRAAPHLAELRAGEEATPLTPPADGDCQRSGENERTEGGKAATPPGSPRTPLPELDGPALSLDAVSETEDEPLAEPGTSVPVASSRAGVREAAVKTASLATARRPSGSKHLAGLPQAGSSLFPEPPQVSREAERQAQLRAAGMAGGYDSMDDEDEEAPHISSCPCCLVRRLPIHQACTSLTPAIAAMRQT